MTIDEQIAALRALAEGMGIGVRVVWQSEGVFSYVSFSTEGYVGLGKYNIAFADIGDVGQAHRFLCSLKRGVRVDIRHYTSRGGEQRVETIWNMPTVRNRIQGGPVDGYPPPAPPGMHYELCLMPDEVADNIEQEDVNE